MANVRLIKAESNYIVFFHVLVVIFMESTLGRPILETFFNLDDLDDLTLCPRFAVNVLADDFRVEFFDHIGFGCIKRECGKHSIATGKIVVARVFGVALHLEGDV
jgi:hypothetical protein